MATNKITFSKLNLKTQETDIELKLSVRPDLTLSVRQYLPQDEKAKLLSFALTNALDIATGTFSPLRLETYFALAVAKWYARIDFTDKQIENAGKTYDALESNNVFNEIVAAIPKDEYEFVYDTFYKTAKDIARFNSSAAGIISNMSGDAQNLDEQLNEILTRIQNKEGIEVLSAIKDVMGEKE